MADPGAAVCPQCGVAAGPWDTACWVCRQPLDETHAAYDGPLPPVRVEPPMRVKPPTDEDASPLTLSGRGTFQRRRRVFELRSDSDLLATMSGSIWKHSGEIGVGDREYEVSAQAMHCDGQLVATYEICNRFVRSPLVEVCDRFSGRQFELRQKRIWSSAALLVEADRPVAEYATNVMHARYQITARKDVPQPALLLSLWLAAIGLVFSG